MAVNTVPSHQIKLLLRLHVRFAETWHSGVELGPTTPILFGYVQTCVQRAHPAWLAAGWWC